MRDENQTTRWRRWMDVLALAARWDKGNSWTEFQVEDPAYETWELWEGETEP